MRFANTKAINEKFHWQYHPYGTTAYQAMNALIKATAKRYRYTGKEKDEESGLYYHGARYYIPWLCRWSASDPINSENYNLQKGYGLVKNRERGFIEFTISSYCYCSCNPTGRIDPNGEREAKPNEVAKAVTKAESYRGQPNSNIPAFSGISRDQVIDQLKTALVDPSNINADGYMCLPTAMTYIMLRYQPENFVNAVMSIYETGSATIPNGETIGFTPEALATLDSLPWKTFLDMSNVAPRPTTDQTNITDLFAGALRSSIKSSDLAGNWDQGSRPGMVKDMADKLGMRILQGTSFYAINTAANQKIHTLFLDDWTVYQNSDQNMARRQGVIFERYGGDQAITLDPETIAGRKFGIHYMVMNTPITFPSTGKMSFNFFLGGNDKYHYGQEIKRFNKGVKGIWITTNK